MTKNRDMGREQKANGAANGLSRLFTLALLSKQTLIDQSIVMSRLWAGPALITLRIFNQKNYCTTQLRPRGEE